MAWPGGGGGPGRLVGGAALEPAEERDPMTPDRDPITSAQADLERSRHLGDELLANLVVLAALLLTLAAVMSLHD
jgi:hypothetical protein